jgi:hypothetical protein
VFSVNRTGDNWALRDWKTEVVTSSLEMLSKNRALNLVIRSSELSGL